MLLLTDSTKESENLEKSRNGQAIKSILDARDLQALRRHDYVKVITASTQEHSLPCRGG